MGGVGTALGLLIGIGIGVYALWVYPRQIEAKRRAGTVPPITVELVEWVRLSGAVVLFAVGLIAVATVLGG